MSGIVYLDANSLSYAFKAGGVTLLDTFAAGRTGIARNSCR
jgi:hypothetical protein